MQLFDRCISSKYIAHRRVHPLSPPFSEGSVFSGTACASNELREAQLDLQVASQSVSDFSQSHKHRRGRAYKFLCMWAGLR